MSDRVKQSTDDVVDDPLKDYAIDLRVRRNFRGRAGWTVIGRLYDPPDSPTAGPVREYEFTKQYPDPGNACGVFADFVRRMSVEDASE